MAARGALREPLLAAADKVEQHGVQHSSDKTLRAQLHDLLEAKTKGGRAFQLFVIMLIVVNVLVFVSGTVCLAGEAWWCTDAMDVWLFGNHNDNGLLGSSVLEIFTVAIFTVEYCLRLWTIGEEPAYRGLRGRLSFIFSFFSLVDLASIIPFYVDFFVSSNLPASQFVRLLRLLRMLRVEGRYIEAFTLFDDVLREQSAVLGTSAFVGASTWILCSASYYLAEHRSTSTIYCGAATHCDVDAVDVSLCTFDEWGFVDCTAGGCPSTPSNPHPCWNLFESIPASLYFTLLSLFGEFPLVDQYSAAGKAVSTVVVVLAVAVFALPVGILANGFEDLLARRSEAKGSAAQQDFARQPAGGAGCSQTAAIQNAGEARKQAATAGGASSATGVGISIVTDASVRARLHAFFARETFAGRLFDVCSSVLIGLSVVSFMLSTVSQVSAPVRASLARFDEVSIWFFSAEFVLRCYAAGEETKYRGCAGTLRSLISFYSLVDIASIAPYWIYMVYSLVTSHALSSHQSGAPHLPGVAFNPSAVAARAALLLRLLKFERYTEAFTVFDDVLAMSLDVLAVTGFMAAVMWVVFSAAMYFVERHNPDESVAPYYKDVPNAMWITLLNLSGESPLGYYSVPGQLITGVLGVFATGFFGIPIGLLGAGFEQWVEEKEEDTPDEVGDATAKKDMVTETDMETEPGKGAASGTDVEAQRPAKGVSAFINGETRAGRAFEAVVFGLIFLSVGLGVVQTVRGFECEGAYGKTEEPHAVLLTDLGSQHGTTAGVNLGARSAFQIGGALGFYSDAQSDAHFKDDGRFAFDLSSPSGLRSAAPAARNGLCFCFATIELIAVLTFTVEYLLRLYSAGTNSGGRVSTRICHVFSFIFSFYSIIDLLAVVPYYVSLVSATSWVGRHDNYLRMLRMLRLLKLDKYAPSITLIDDVVRLKRNALAVAGFAAATLWFIFSGLLYLSETGDTDNALDDPLPAYGCTDECTMADRFQNFFDSLVYTGVHLTGDYPIVSYDTPSRIACFVMICFSVGVVSVPSSLLAAGFAQVVQSKAKRRRGETRRAGDGYFEREFAKLEGMPPPPSIFGPSVDEAQRAVNAFLNGDEPATATAKTAAVGTAAGATTGVAATATGTLRRTAPSRAFRSFIFAVIIANVIAVMAESVPAIDKFVGNSRGNFFDCFEALSVLTFSVEYLLRLFSVSKDKQHLYSRLFYATTFFGIVDLVAIAPWYVQQVLEATGYLSSDSDVATVFRIVRVVRILSLERFVTAFTVLDNVFRASQEMLAATGLMAALIWVGSATCLFLFEKDNPNWRTCDDGVPAVANHKHKLGCYDFASTAECNRYYPGMCHQVGFVDMPDSLYYTAVFLGGEWGKIDFTWGGRAVCLFLCLAGIAIYALPVATLFDSFGAVLGMADDDDEGEAEEEGEGEQVS